MKERHQVLALSGGGYRGLYSATFLAHCENHFKTACRNQFQLIAGTSTGALLAAGLACGEPADKLAKKFQEHGTNIFKRNVFTGVTQIFLNAPYAASNLQAAIRETIGAENALRPLKEIDTPLLITAVNYSTGRSTIFRSRGLAGSSASDATLCDAIIASAAAPTYFPLKIIAPDEYVDGGLVANAPDMVALTEAITRQDKELADLYLLSIGTAGRTSGAAVQLKPRQPGAISWILMRRLVQTIMGAQEALAIDQASALLRERYLRIDSEPNEMQVGAIKALDKAGPSASRTLISMANQRWQAARETATLSYFFKT